MSILLDTKDKPGLGNNFFYIMAGLTIIKDKMDKDIQIKNIFYNLCFKPYQKKANQEVICIGYTTFKNYSEKIWNVNNFTFYQEMANKFILSRVSGVIKNRVAHFKRLNFDSNTISIAIRSWNSSTNNETNNLKAYKRSKIFQLDSYYKILDSIEYKDKRFFVAVDNSKLKPILKKKYGDKIFFFNKIPIPKIKGETSKINDLIELILLSKNKILIGNESSSFFRMAAFFSKPGSEIIFV